MQRLQGNQLLHYPQQEKGEGKVGYEEILQPLQKTHST
jgi:hypothetical protein